jgi:preprotein translocase subunit YajC
MFDLAWAQETGGATGGAGSNTMFSMLLMWLPIILIFYFLVIRPGKKKQDQRREMLNNLSKGDRIVTQGGLIGTIVGTSEKTITVKLGDNMKVKLIRGAIAGPADTTED